MPTALYSPAAEIDKYNKIVQDRGYDFFSSQAMAAHKAKYGNKATGDIISEAKQKHKDFMAAVNDINHRDHPKAYNTFTTKFKSDEAVALDHFKNEELEKNGRLPEQWPARNSNYEKNTLKQQQPDKASNFVESRQYATLKSLLETKWKAVGYAGDDAVINEYNREYCHK